VARLCASYFSAAGETPSKVNWLRCGKPKRLEGDMQGIDLDKALAEALGEEEG
jgi:hypothetical protein